MSSRTEKPTEAETEVDEATAILVRARGFIERGWCRGTLARDRHRHKVKPTSTIACRWCAIGALFAAGVPPFVDDHPADVRLRESIGTGEPVSAFNDRQKTVEPVLAAFDRAIADRGCGR